MSTDPFQPDVLRAHSVRHAEDFSLDPYAGGTFGGKAIWTPDEAADNLNRHEVNWTFGNNDELSDGILTYGFWTEAEIRDSYYSEPGANSILADSLEITRGNFAPFTAEQQAMAIQNLQLWDDLIAVTFQRATTTEEADITFGFVQMSPAAGAHAYYPQEEAFNEAYGTTELGRTGGDVWANYLYQGDFSGANTQAGGYGWFAIAHELGHSFGLAHGGDYNASDDNDGDGQPDPITYEDDAYFFAGLAPIYDHELLRWLGDRPGRGATGDHGIVRLRADAGSARHSRRAERLRRRLHDPFRQHRLRV